VEIIYAGLLVLTASVLIYLTLTAENKVDIVANHERPAVTVDVTAAKWEWEFRYRGDGIVVRSGTVGRQPLVVPVDEAIRFNLASQDVIHALWVPEVRFKRDLIPGTVEHVTLTFTRAGLFPGQCARDRVTREPQRPRDRPLGPPLNQHQPSDLRPLLHADHTLPRPIDTDQTSLNGRPDTPNPTPRGLVFNRRRWPSIHPAPTSPATPRAPSPNKRILGQDRLERCRLPTSRETEARSCQRSKVGARALSSLITARSVKAVEDRLDRVRNVTCPGIIIGQLGWCLDEDGPDTNVHLPRRRGAADCDRFAHEPSGIARSRGDHDEV
jgi:hypothetical protein